MLAPKPATLHSGLALFRVVGFISGLLCAVLCSVMSDSFRRHGL